MQLRVICIISLAASMFRDRPMHIQPPAAPPAISPSPAGTRRIKSGELMAGDREIVILHDGQEYRLRVTNAGKLILTK
jgi:hemin uptake protein HemP